MESAASRPNRRCRKYASAAGTTLRSLSITVQYCTPEGIRTGNARIFDSLSVSAATTTTEPAHGENLWLRHEKPPPCHSRQHPISPQENQRSGTAPHLNPGRPDGRSGFGDSETGSSVNTCVQRSFGVSVSVSPAVAGRCRFQSASRTAGALRRRSTGTDRAPAPHPRPDHRRHRRPSDLRPPEFSARHRR